MRHKKVCLFTLGCPKNLVDSENILAVLGQENYILTDIPEEADIVIVNTCGFIKPAVDESIRLIRKLCRKKRKGQKIVAYGCLVNRYGKDMPYIEGVDAMVGGGSPVLLVNTIKKGMRKGFIPGDCSAIESYPRIISTYPYAYIKISDGCENFCSYCLIPEIRGRLRSRNIKDIYSEAGEIEKMGIKELILVAQDTGNYGKDIKGSCLLDKLLIKLCRRNFFWLRVMYLHPAHITEKFLEVVAKEKKICRYLDIPLQHIHPEILKRMNRPVMDYGRIIDKIRKTIPGIRLRTTFIVGFPGEKESHFKALVDFIKEKEFDRLGVFRYSREKGTPAYYLSNQIDEETKKGREGIIMEIQKGISYKKLQGMVGMEMDVLVEGRKGNYFTGRTEFDAPEIDGMVYIKSGRDLKPGDICRIRITSATFYDLYGEPLS